MTLFAFFWAAFLPHHAVVISLFKFPALLGASPYAVGLSPDQDAPDQDTAAARLHSPLHWQALAHRPSPLEPQLVWSGAAEIDWQQWHAAALVTIIPRSTHLSSGNVNLRPGLGLCGSYDRSIQPTDVDGFTVQVKNRVIGRLPSRQMAEAVAGQIREAVPKLEASPDALTPSLGATESGGQISGQTVFVLPDLDADQSHAPLQATQWVNNLRLAFGAPPLNPSQVQMVSYGLGETHQTFGGTASWYGPYFHGRQTATGETFNQHEMTAAHKTLPFGTYLQVRNQLNGKTVVVRINDRGPYIGERSLDLSYAAAQCLGAEQPGVIPYQATILAPGLPSAWREESVAARP